MYRCMSISKDRNSFLKYDSYISCNAVFSYDDNEINKRLGRLHENDIQRLLNHIAKVGTFSQAEKDLIKAALAL